MKLFLSHASSSEVIGGIEVYAGFMKKVFPDIELVDYHSMKSKLGDSTTKLFREPERARLLGELVKKDFPDAEMVFTNGMFSWNLQGLPQINICHGTYLAFAEKALPLYSLDYYRLKYIYSNYERKAALNSSAVIANSSATARNASKIFGCAAEIIHPPVDLDAYLPEPRESAKKKLEWGGTNVLFIGRPEKAKGFHFVESLARRNPGINFRCILSRPYSSEIPNLFHYKPVAHPKLPAFYNACDAVLFPSLFEGCGLVTLEALSLNRKVVCLETGIAAEIESDNVAISSPSIDSLQQSIDDSLGSKPSNSRKIIQSDFSFAGFKKRWRHATEGR